MNIALIGYGKMGHVIEGIALERGHTIAGTYTSANASELTVDALRAADVAIEFTHPGAALHNINLCIEAGVSVVSGTTGWNDDIENVKKRMEGAESAFIHASNFSIGVNLFFVLNTYLARLMAPHSEYKPLLTETHHTQKKDAPSGTAIALAKQIIGNNPAYTEWTIQDHTTAGVIPIVAHREDPVPGTHTVRYTSDIDDIEITHTAHNRTGFALGAVLAAEFIYDKKGVFTMKDVLGIGK